MEGTQKADEELLRYLSGEISFDAWLEKQDIPQNAAQQQETIHDEPVVSDNQQNYFEEDSTIFTSWGNIFTSSSAASNLQKSIVDMDDVESDDLENSVSNLSMDEETEELIDPLPSRNNPTIPNVLENKYRLPSFANVPEYNEKEAVVQGYHIIPIIEKLHPILKDSTVREIPMLESKSKKNQVEELPDIVKDFQAFQLKKYAAKSRRKLPDLLRMQMGQANLLCAKGDFKQAADICMQVVREAPSSGQPFKTLAFIYEEQGDKEMSLQYSLISAFLDCKDANEWMELAKKCSDAGNMKQTLVCYDRACKYNTSDLALQWERSVLYFENMDYRKCLDIYQIISKLLIPSDRQVYIEGARSIAKVYHEFGMTDKAAETIEAALVVCPGLQDVEAVHLLSDVLLERKQYRKCIKLFTNHCGVMLPTDFMRETEKLSTTQGDIESEKALKNYLENIENKHFEDSTSSTATKIINNIMQNEEVNSAEHEKKYFELQPVSTTKEKLNDIVKDCSISVPNDFPLDLRVKLAICLIYCKKIQLVKTLIEVIYLEDIESIGDLLLDISEAYLDIGQHKEALVHLKELILTEKYNQAAIWLKIAECHHVLQNNEETINAYYKVLSLAPLQAGVRFSLSSLLRKVGREDEAMNVLAEYEDACKDDDGMEQKNISDENRLKVEEYTNWYSKCLQMYQQGEYKDFLYHSYILLDNYLMSSFHYQKKQMIGKVFIWELMLKTLKVSVKMNEGKKAINIIEKAMMYKPFGETKRYRLDLDYLMTTTCVVSGDYARAFDSFRMVLQHENDDIIDRNALWVLFAVIANKAMDKRHHRFTLRYLFRKPKFVPQIIRNGNNSHVSGTYKYAIGEFARAFRQWPTYPLNSLLLGVSFLHLSCQKFARLRHNSILQGLVFMYQYFKLREENQEAYYNLARAFHQIGLVHFAVFYYNKALEFPLYNEKESSNCDDADWYHPHVDLHREAAYNLSIIYRASGNKDLARDILYKYCWV